MKKHTNILLLLASLAIIVLLSLAVFITIYMRGAADSPGTAQADTAALAPSVGSRIESRTGTIEEAAAELPHSFVFVGDSRTLAMADAVKSLYSDDTCTYIAREGEGLHWFRNDGIKLLQEVLTELPEAVVILNLGVNDLKEQDAYIEYYEKLFGDYPEASFYVMSVNPLEEDKFTNFTNQEITTFNNALQTAFPDRYLDCYHYLLDDAFTTIDGIHYPPEVSRRVHHYAVSVLADQ